MQASNELDGTLAVHRLILAAQHAGRAGDTVASSILYSDAAGGRPRDLFSAFVERVHSHCDAAIAGLNRLAAKLSLGA